MNLKKLNKTTYVAAVLFSFLAIYAAKSGPAVLGVTVFLLLLSSFRSGFSPLKYIRDCTEHSEYFFLILLALFGLSSWFWAVHPNQTLIAALKLIGLLTLMGGGAIAIKSLRLSKLDSILACFKLSYLLALVVFAVEEMSGSWLFHQYYKWLDVVIPSLSQNVHKMSAMVIVLLFWPFAHHLIQEKRWFSIGVLWLLIIAIVYKANATTALIAHTLSLPMYCIFYFFPSIKRWLFGYFLPLIIMTFPLITKYIFAVENFTFAAPPNTVLFSFYVRLKFWEFANEKLLEHPLIGWGLGCSKGFPGSDEEILPGVISMCLHPHNNILQLWLELGGIGALLLSLFCYVFFTQKRHTSNALNAIQGTAFFCIIIFGLISFSLWHSFWLAWIGVCALILITHMNREKILGQLS